MNILFLGWILAVIAIILNEFKNRNLGMFFLHCWITGVCILCCLFGMFCTFADICLPVRISTVIEQRAIIEENDEQAIAAFNRKVSNARAPWCLRYLFYDPAYRGIQPLSTPEPDFWEAPNADNKQ